MDKRTDKNTSFQPDVDPLLLKNLIQKSDMLGLLHFAIYFIILILLGCLSFVLLGSTWFFPVFLLYAIVFAFSEAAAHELNHDTVFRTKWLNVASHWLVCFLSWREPIYSKYRHLRHHAHTSVIGMDPEGEAVRTKSVRLMTLEMFTRFFHARIHLGAIVRHSLGRIDKTDQKIVPKGMFRKMILQSRIFFVGYLTVLGLSLYFQTWLLILFLILPRSLGTFVHDLCARTQHTALAVNNPDLRVTTRTVYLGPVLRFFYWNMNYHLEHHLYQNVPFHALPKLHETLKDKLPETPSGLMQAWKLILPAILIQQHNPDYFLKPVLPS